MVVLAGQSSGALEWIGCIFGVLLAVAGVAVALAVRLVAKLMRVVPENGYGLCSGWSNKPKPGDPPLTGWLNEKLTVRRPHR